MSRAYYIDRIRVILTALVVLHHTAITYGAPGGWYYRELPFTGSLTGLFQVLFVSVNQAYFMGFFFLIAGYFTLLLPMTARDLSGFPLTAWSD